MAHHISQLESELQNIPEAAPKASLSLSVSEKLARDGSSALSGVEHLTLLVGKESIALAFAPRAKRMTNEPSILVSEVALGNSRWIWLPSHAPAILQPLGSRVIA